MRLFALLLLAVLTAPVRADGPSLYFIDTGPLRLRDTADVGFHLGVSHNF